MEIFFGRDQEGDQNQTRGSGVSRDGKPGLQNGEMLTRCVAYSNKLEEIGLVDEDSEKIQATMIKYKISGFLESDSLRNRPPGAVSYTHLDVYKRQEIRGAKKTYLDNTIQNFII